MCTHGGGGVGSGNTLSPPGGRHQRLGTGKWAEEFNPTTMTEAASTLVNEAASLKHVSPLLCCSYTGHDFLLNRNHPPDSSREAVHAQSLPALCLGDNTVLLAVTGNYIHTRGKSLRSAEKPQQILKAEQPMGEF